MKQERRRMKMNEQAAAQGTPSSGGPSYTTDSVAFSLAKHGFEGFVVRTLFLDGVPWFVAADVCRALDLTPHKGSFGGHLGKLDHDDKKQISRDAVMAATTTPGLNLDGSAAGARERSDAGPERADDPLVLEKAPQTWIVSESGLYTLALRSRWATTPGTFAYRFRRWLTKEVLPEIRRTGSYAPNGRSDDVITLSRLDVPVRYIVMSAPGRPPHVRQMPIEAILGERTALDCEGLCYALKTIENWWHKVQQRESVGGNPRGGFALARLAQAIIDGAWTANQYLWVNQTHNPAATAHETRNLSTLDG